MKGQKDGSAASSRGPSPPDWSTVSTQSPPLGGHVEVSGSWTPWQPGPSVVRRFGGHERGKCHPAALSSISVSGRELKHSKGFQPARVAPRAGRSPRAASTVQGAKPSRRWGSGFKCHAQGGPMPFAGSGKFAWAVWWVEDRVTHRSDEGDNAVCQRQVVPIARVRLTIDARSVQEFVRTVPP